MNSKYDMQIDLRDNSSHRKIIDRVKPGSVILECGCSTGYMTRYLKEKLSAKVYIVEKNRDLFASASAYAEDGICADLDGEDWTEKFSGIRFDYVIFADVLEHLKRPQEALKAAASLLKNDGTIMCSIPNVAHDDIVMNLFFNRWNYTPIGLLDDSHIHFWGKDNISPFFESAGLTLTDCDYVIAPPLTTEQRVPDDTQEPAMASSVYRRKYGDVYQFVFSAMHTQFVKDNAIELKDYYDARHAQYGELSEKCKATVKAAMAVSEELDNVRKQLEEESDLRRKAQRLSQELNIEKAELQQRAEKAARDEAAARQRAELAEREKSQTETNRRLSEERCQIEKERLEVERTQARAQAQEALDSRRRAEEAFQQANAELYVIKSSRTWRISEKLHAILRFLVPIGSKRALFFRLIWTLISHPAVFFRSLKKKKLSKFFSLLKQGKIAEIGHLIRYNISPEKFPLPDFMSESGYAHSLKPKAPEDYVRLKLPEYDEPLVSIIIPVYNQFEYTYNCVASIIRNTKDIKYEVILANDNSSDATQQAETILSNVRVVSNEKNLGFLLNCNNAAKHARGKYILLLNNDTSVEENWLSPLVELIERSDDIGMVGSKLVYPDGTLQEAGGILWSDGSAWNYGNGQNPARPEYNYVKEVDYISGASIMIRRSLWEEIGGFDESFVPAYYEDTDLAFEVRRHGYKVMYQPLSVVVHYEGKSNGTDTASGMKHYQVVNAQKFFAKWKKVLESEHTPNGVNAFQSRDRSRGGKTVFMVDHYVPTFDKDAGSRCVFQYIQLFVSEGYTVKFVGDNFYPTQPYTTILQQMGVEVLADNYYAKNWEKWMEENGEYIGYAFLNRPHIAPNYIDALRRYTHAMVAYFGHDLHFLREMREYEITGDPALLESSNTWRAKELAVMRKMDVAYYPSIVEENMVRSIDPSINVKAIPLNIFDDINEQPFEPEKRSDVIFIGGFNHRPNVDAVKWLSQEIMPELLKLVPDIKVHVLGSNAPEELMKLSDEHMIMEGYVTDETLAWYYKRSRVTIAPLRYGAGIKGKVVEAMHSGMPMVTTSIGAEGLSGAEDILVIEDDAKQFARRLAELYKNPEMLKARSKASYQYIRDTFSRENAIRIIGPDFDMQV